VGSLVAVVRLIYIPNTLIVSENAAATVNNIARHELLFRFGILSQLLTGALWIFVTLALYRLFKGVDRGLAVLMVILGSLMQVPIFFVNSVNDAAALLFVRSTDFLSLFDKPQRDAFAMLFLNLHHYGDLANEIFWGLWLLPFGLLVYKSRFLPRVLGAWLMIACFGLLSVQLYRVTVASLRRQGHQLHPTSLAGRGRNHAIADNRGREGTALGRSILITRRKYPKGIKIPNSEMAKLNLVPADFHGDWNYSLLPRGN
jgi:hypothetical protein